MTVLLVGLPYFDMQAGGILLLLNVLCNDLRAVYMQNYMTFKLAKLERLTVWLN